MGEPQTKKHTNDVIDPTGSSPKGDWQVLFTHLAEQHGLTLTDSECHDVAMAADAARMKAYGANWILSNALRYLDPQQLADLKAALVPTEEK